MNKETATAHVESIVSWLILGVECIGATVIAFGVLMALRQILSSFLKRRASNFGSIRLDLARYLALALEFQLGADILSTAIAPSFEEIKKLGAIAVIRTALNYFLSREMRDEKETLESEKSVTNHTAGEVSTKNEEANATAELSPAQKARLAALGEAPTSHH
ncbi:putative membrane protein [Abditibacterium utsteinense]|uniref:Putative membrane protein n=1 Tax=Abditibacterium utsteinense TaxID=1960156 RepID=A0A2S8SV19_9BACT|nr:DUF1622 domain-containing protein [Abditibacterium utsteinense]PQV64647.1 putative membrane protein [Abditibacterium utsteinense]